MFITRAIIVTLSCLVLLAGCMGESSQEFYEEGRQVFEQGNVNGAIVLFKSALEQDPGFYDARLQLGIAYLYTGKLPQAETELQKASRQQPDDVEVLVALAKLYTAWNKGAEALAPLDTITRLSLDTAESDELRGIALSQMRDMEGAVTAFNSALARDSKRIQARTSLASLYIVHNMFDKAREQIDTLLADVPSNYDALRLLTRLEMASGTEETQLKAFRLLLSEHTKDQYGRYMEGVIRLRRGDRDFVLARLTNMEKTKPKDYYTRMLRGAFAQSEGDYPAAIDAFQQCVVTTPSIEAYFKLGMAFYANGDLETALSQFQVVVDRLPDDQAARQMIGTILFQQNRMAEASQIAEKLISLNTENPWAHNMLGNTLLAQGRVEEAERAFDQAIAQEPGMTMAHLQKGAIHEMRGEPDKVLRSLQEAVAGAPDNIQARDVLARFHGQRGNHTQARKVLEEGLSGAPADAHLYALMGGQRQNLGDFDGALEDFAKAHEADPLFEPVYFEVAKIHASRGEETKALEELDTFLGMHPESVRALVASSALLDILGREMEAQERVDKAFTLSSDVRLFEIAAVRLIRNERDDEAIALLEGVDAIEENNPLRTLEARIHMRRDMPEKALAVYDKVLVSSPVFALSGKYGIFMLQEKYKEALNIARKIANEHQEPGIQRHALLLETRALELLGETDTALNLLGTAYERDPSPQILLEQAALAMRSGQPEKAQVFIDVAIKKYDQYPPAKAALASFHLERNEERKAIAIYEDIIEGGTANLAVLNNLAMLYARSGEQKERALQMAYAAYLQSPVNPQVLDTFGVVLFVNERVDEAVRVLERAVAISPEDATMRFHYARALYHNGNMEEAKKEINHALNLGDFPERKEAQTLLGKLGNV